MVESSDLSAGADWDGDQRCSHFEFPQREQTQPWFWLWIFLASPWLQHREVCTLKKERPRWRVSKDDNRGLGACSSFWVLSIAFRTYHAGVPMTLCSQTGLPEFPWVPKHPVLASGVLLLQGQPPFHSYHLRSCGCYTLCQISWPLLQWKMQVWDARKERNRREK